LNVEYGDSERAAKNVSERIKKVESVAEDLFTEWEEELKLYKNAYMRRSSSQKLKDTRQQYQKMLDSMRKAEKSMTPVLSTFQDNVLFLKHNLNAQAIGSLRSEFSSLKTEIENLIKNMNDAIQTSNRFIEDLRR
jgi:septation ring formation regulator EzrA